MSLWLCGGKYLQPVLKTHEFSYFSCAIYLYITDYFLNFVIGQVILKSICVFKRYLFVFVYEKEWCIRMHCLWRPEDDLDLLEPEFQKVVDHPTRVSGTELWSSTRAASTVNLWALAPPLLFTSCCLSFTQRKHENTKWTFFSNKNWGWVYLYL